jgi:hypothetical protein
MNGKNRGLQKSRVKPVVVQPVVVQPARHSIEDILRHVDPAPDEETERFLEIIYEDRRRSAEIPPYK